MVDHATYADCTTESAPASSDEADYVQTAQAGQSMADELRSWRKRLGFSPTAAAQAIDAPVATWRGWEVGRPPALPGVIRKLLWFIERDATANKAPAPQQTEKAVKPIAAPVTAPAHNIPQTLSRPTVEPFFRPSGKGRSKG